MASNIQKKQYPHLYDFNGSYKCELTEAINVTESLRFGGLSSMTFEYPRYELDRHNNIQYDNFGNPKHSPKYDFIENDIKVLMNKGLDNEKWYILKIDEDNRDGDNKLFASCTCHEIQFLLQEKMVEYLNLTPPIHLAVTAEDAISEVLEVAQQLRDGYVVSGSGTSIVIDTNAHPTDDIYIGYKIKILKGTGVGQEKTITDYDGTTKTVTLDTSLTTALDTTSVYRIYNDEWKVGTIDLEFSTDLRAHYFDFVNALDSLIRVRDKYFDTNDENGYLTFTSSFNSISGKWENYVNLVKANDYNGIDIRYKKNMKSIIRRKNSEELYTKIIPSGVDNLTVGAVATINRTDSLITYPEHIYGQNAIYNFKYFLEQGYTYKQCMDNFIKTYYFADSRYVNYTDLYTDSKKLLEKMAIPKFTYILSALDLSKLTGREYEEFDIGDTVRVYDEEQGIDIYAVISTINRNQDNPQNADIEITNYVDRISDVLSRIINRNDKYTDKEAQYGNVATYIIADRLTSKNWRQADYVIQPTDSASEIIQNLIDYIGDSSGARIILLDGIYKFKTTLTMRSNIAIEGQGVGTFIMPSTSLINAFTISNKENISFKSFVVGYNYTDLLYFNYLFNISTNSNNIIFENMYMRDNYRGAVNAANSQNISLKYCDFKFDYISPARTFYSLIKSATCINFNSRNNTFYMDKRITYMYTVEDSAVSSGVVSIDGDYIYTSNFIYVCFNMDTNYSNVSITNTLLISESNDSLLGVSHCALVQMNSGNFSNNKIFGNVAQGFNIFGDKNIVQNNTANIAGGIHGMYINGNSNNVQTNTIERGSAYTTLTQMDYGIYLDIGSNNIVAGNELANSGTVNSFSDFGTGTKTLGGNSL